MGVWLSSTQGKQIQRKNGSQKSSLLCLLLCLGDSCSIPTLWPENNNLPADLPNNKEVPNASNLPASKVPNNKEVPNAHASKVPNNKEVPIASNASNAYRGDSDTLCGPQGPGVCYVDCNADCRDIKPTASASRCKSSLACDIKKGAEWQ